MNRNTSSEARYEHGFHTSHYVHEVAEDLSDVIEECLKQADEDAVKAAELLEYRARQDDDLYRALTMKSLPAMCREKIHAYFQLRRARIFKGGGQSLSDDRTHFAPADLSPSDGQRQRATHAIVAVAPIDQQGARLRAVARAALLELPLPVNQKPLRDATVEDVRAATNYYDKRARTCRQRADFFQRVLKHMEIGKVVSECLTENKLQEFWHGQ